MNATLTPAAVLAVLDEVWDMPTLAEQHREVIDWLAARYEVHFGMASEVIIYDHRTHQSTRFETTDVRVALRSLLAGPSA